MEIIGASKGSCYCFRKFQEKNPIDLEKDHTNYLKRSLNINKHASSLCVYEELDRFPTTHRAWSMAIKYWLQITTGTQNRLLNEAYKTDIHEKQNWVQCSQTLLNTHGFGDVWLKPFIASCYFHKLFQTRLDDQFKQKRRSKLLSSSRFDTLKYFIEDDRQESYIYKIRNPCIRRIFTRLRIDMKVLSTYRIYKTIAPACPLRSRKPGSVLHIVLKCPVYDRQYNLLIDKIVSRSPSFPNWDDFQMLIYIVDLDCPPGVINQCCKFIAEIYALREPQSTANSQWSNMT